MKKTEETVGGGFLGILALGLKRLSIRFSSSQTEVFQEEDAAILVLESELSANYEK